MTYSTPQQADTRPEAPTTSAPAKSQRFEEKSSQDTIAASTTEPFPTLDDKEAGGIPRPSDVSTVVTPRAHSNPFETDIEAAAGAVTYDKPRTSGLSNVGTWRKSWGAIECTTGGSDCQVWPGQDHWKRKAKAAKKKRHTCNCMANMSKRTRVVVKILILLLIVGLAVGVGFGVSKPLGAGIWKSSTQNRR